MGQMKISEGANGVFMIAATPFAERGELDLDSTDRLVDFYLSSGVAGITILGMMGEASKLTVDETSRFMRRALARVDERVPIRAAAE
jgi:4-hydroxy-tetrahydrodipicolinate synthase